MEDKKKILELLALLVKETRAGEDITDISLDQNEEFATITYQDGYTSRVCVVCDSGIALIRDITRAIN